MSELNAQKREEVGRQYTKQLRRTGKVPGVYYTRGVTPVPVVVDEKALRTIISEEVNILDLNMDGESVKCVVREVQYDPVRGKPVHVDFMGIRMDEKIHVTIPVHLVGTPEGVKTEGGILQQTLREIDVMGLPTDLPEHIDVDVSSLTVGDSIHLADVTIDKVEILTDLTRSIATVSAPTVVREVEVEEVEEEVAEEEEEGIEEEQKTTKEEEPRS